MRPALALVIACCVATPTIAMPDKARQLERAADTDRVAGRLEDAFAGYRLAWIAYPSPRYLYRLGQCQHLLGDDERALFFFQRYLDKKAVPPFKKKVERHVAVAHEKIAAARALRKEPRIAVLPLRGNDQHSSAEVEALTEQIHQAVTARRPGQVRGLDATYTDLHLASLVGMDCQASDDACVRELMPLLGVDAVVVGALSADSLTLRVVPAAPGVSGAPVPVLFSQVPEGVERVIP